MKFNMYSTFKERLRDSERYQRLLIPLYEKLSENKRFVFINKDEKHSCQLVNIIQNSGCDTILQTKTGSIAIEEKFRSQDKRKYGDVIVETWSCSVPGREKAGWIKTCKADYLNYCFVMSDYLECYILDMHKLKNLWSERGPWKEIATREINRTKSDCIPLSTIKSTIGYWRRLVGNNGVITN